MAHPGVALIPDPEATVDALRQAGARFAFVHGSRASGAARPGSDIDVAAWFGGLNPAPWTVAGLPSSIDLLVLDEAPLELAGRVALRGVLLFPGDLVGHHPKKRVTDDLDALDAYTQRDPGEVAGDAAFLGHVKYLFKGPKRSYLGLFSEEPEVQGREEPR
jgi:hypothetical protein